ncbi:MAG TPA: class II fructose-bisphosphate aldolase [Coriobacteriia bacterium]|nr:class II fructose-bisphosphate aldolase [Coriobacteriia bacterium]
MPLTTTHEMLRSATDEGWAVCAFNIENMEMAQAVVAAAEKAGAPVILQTTPSTVRYAGLRMYRAIADAVAADATVPVAMHLDHGDSFELAAQALRLGYSSIMFDGSPCAYEENIAVTAAVVRACAPNGIPVEGELGRVGGKEDDLVVDAATFTDPDQAVDFVQRTGISSFAVAIGTVHGAYKGTPVLDLDLLRRIRDVVEIPLVLHGSSGLPEEAVKACIAAGIAKVNFATELRQVYSAAVESHLAAAPGTIDPKKYSGAAREAVQQLAADKIRLYTTSV